MATKVNHFGQKYAFLIIHNDIAQEMIKKRMFGKGWNRWRVKEEESIVRCYRCKGVGHLARERQRKEEGFNCFNCGEVGHQKRECQFKQKCYLCKVEGCKAELMKCPSYKKKDPISKRVKKRNTTKRDEKMK